MFLRSLIIMCILLSYKTCLRKHHPDAYVYALFQVRLSIVAF
jgi:hypothetical protein